MIRWLFRLAALATLMAGGASAQGLFVQTGEHEGFTRLVVRIPAQATWSAVQTDQQIELILENHTRGFNVSRAFDLIPKDRISDMVATQNRLTLSLNCDCRASAYLDQNRYLIMDVALPDHPFSAPEISLGRAQRPVANASITPRPIPDTVAALPGLYTPERQVRKDPPQTFGLNRAALDESESEALRAMQERLARELGSAATRGILTHRPGATRVETPDVAAPIPDAEAAPQLPEVELTGLANNMRITSSMDMPRSATPGSGSVSLSGAVCPDNPETDIAGWSDGRTLYDQLGPLRATLYGEFDKLQPDQAVELAKLYLHFGFGAEARDILTLDPTTAQKNYLLLAIADIMENGHAASGPTLRPLIDCDTDVSLWAVLAQDTLVDDDTVDFSAALFALNKLPAHLRRFLAPELSNRLLAYGDQTAAAAALRSVERLPESPPSAVKLSQAKLALDQGDVARGTAKLKVIKNDNAPEAVEALITLVDTQLAADQPIDPETAGLVAAYAKEYKGSELGPALRRAHVLALVKSGQFDKAFDEARQLGADLEDADAIELRLQLLGELTAYAEDVVFLDQIFSQKNRDIARLPPAEKTALASRLLALGFPAQAQQTLSSLPDRPIREDRQILAARIALALNQPMRAFSALIELQGREIDTLRAQAKAMAGDHSDAYRLFAESGQTENAARSAWLADDLGRETLADNPVFGPVVGLTGADVAPNQSTDGMLQRTGALLDESRSARATLTQFLSTSDLDF